MKIGDIIVPIKYHQIYDETRFKEAGIVLGRPYKCIETLVLTSDRYYIPEFASLPGVTIVVKRDRWGLSRPCMPAECFRLATTEERREWMLDPPHHDWTRGGKQLRALLNRLKRSNTNCLYNL